ncbi:Putative uncharacterized protein FLJ37770 [Araneus ventricosus]|uniref:Mos1 transposase HTH domain-containing protein n=1 Tax=Araneus ventricosus TaxID=182803 RepID=A0A4Y2CLR8_ARAVE|nr:Putative uncharacterized protein FLJ37770 [Araneus ventricosus]
MEQRVNIKFCFKLGKTATETHEMLVKVYGVDAVSKKCVFEWFKRFRDGKENVKDEPSSARPPTSTTPDNIERVRRMLADDRRLSFRMIAEELKISLDSFVYIIYILDTVSRRYRKLKGRPCVLQGFTKLPLRCLADLQMAGFESVFISGDGQFYSTPGFLGAF